MSAATKRVKCSSFEQKPTRSPYPHVPSSTRKMMAVTHAQTAAEERTTQRGRTSATAIRHHDLAFDVSHVRPSVSPSPVVAHDGCTYQLRSRKRVSPNFSCISCGFMATTNIQTVTHHKYNKTLQQPEVQNSVG